jgi:Domain of unknown function (DUF3883)
MARSAGNPERRFLVKVNEDDAPSDQNGMPVGPAEWEGRTFFTGPPRQEIEWREAEVPPEGKRDPSPWDQLYIWINGQGLCATAVVADLSRDDEGVRPERRRRIQVMNVRPYNPVGIINDSNIDDLHRTVFEDIAKSRRVTLRHVLNADAHEIDEAVSRLTGCSTANGGSLTAPVPGVSALSGGRGQGFRAWAQGRMEVEKRGTPVATELLRSQGWFVDDRSRYESYDLLCSRGGREVYAEVKGSSEGDSQIIITNREVEFAREHRQHMLLLVVSDIEIRRDADGNVSAHGGTPHLHWEWAPEESQLRPIAYTCTLSRELPSG